MENFKIVKEESFESLSRYLNLIYKLTELEHPLAFVDVDGKRCIITKIVNYDTPVDNGYLIAYEEDGEIKPIGVFYENDKFLVNMGDMAYKIGETSILRENMVNHFKEQLSCSETIESEPKKYFNYHQNDQLNGVQVDMNYIIHGHNDPSTVLPFLKNKKPVAIDITQRILFLQYLRQYVLCDTVYSRYRRVNDDVVLLLPMFKKYGCEDMFDLINSYGCNDAVPDDMISLYNGTNKDIKRLKIVADTYRKNTGL